MRTMLRVVLVMVIAFMACVAVAQSADNRRPISFIVKEGHVSTPLPLLEAVPDLVEGSQFVVSRGPGRFVVTAQKRQRASIHAGTFIVPSVQPGGIGEETFVELRPQDRVLLDHLRFVTVPANVFEVLRTEVEVGESGVYHRSDTMIVVDENAWMLSPPEIDYPEGFVVEVPARDGFVLRSRAGRSVQIAEPGDPLIDYPGGGDEDGEPDRCPNYSCYANPFPPGVVNWKMPDPVASGFSIKPEYVSNALACPSPPRNGVDGVYRVSWGCGNALKIPDNCEADL